ncbi:MAG: glycosyltransferase [Syntrophomonas sp.]
MKKIVFIVDGGAALGLGHVYQTITFAKLLKHKGEICFLTKSGETVVNKIRDAGFITHKLASDYEILDYLHKNLPNVVIIDNVDVSVELARDIKKDGNIRLVIFTNLTSANRFADVAVTADISCHFNNIRFMNNDTNTLYFYGPKYWILREEFHEFHNKNKAMPESINNILVIFGGSDPSNLTTLVIKELLNLPDYTKIDVILGASFTHFDSLNQVLQEYEAKKKNINIHKNISNVAELMFNADLVIASPGISAFEALLVGTPIILFPQDFLQRETYKSFIKIIAPEDVAGLLSVIANRSFTYPNQEEIIEMHIGEGTEEIIKAILEE